MDTGSNAKASQTALSVAGQKLLSHWNADLILSQVIKDAVKVLGGTGGDITLRDPGQAVYRSVAIYNLPEAMLSLAIPPNQSLSSAIFATGQPQIVRDYREFPARVPLLSNLGHRSTIGVPLNADEEVIGALIVTTSHERQFQERDIDVLMAFANMAAIAIQGTRLHSENLQSMARLARAARKLDQQAKKLRLLLSRVFDAQEEERRRIARGLHDSVVQSILASHLELSLAQQVLSTAPADAIRCIAAASGFLDEAHSEIRGVINNLRPARLDKDGLIGALDYLVSSTEDSLGLQCSFTVIGRPSSLDANKEITVYRIVQEAIANIRKHSAATRASIRIQFEPKRLIAMVEDNGIGFDPSRADGSYAAERLGLVSMRERAESVRGKLCIDSRIGRGTVISLMIPLTDVDDYTSLTDELLSEWLKSAGAAFEHSEE